MSAEETYIRNVLGRVWVDDDHRRRLEADLRAHFARAREDGEPAASVAARLGAPEEVAAEMMADVEIEVAGFWERTVAFFADIAVLFGVAIPFLAGCALLVPWLQRLDGATWADVPVILALLAAVSLGVAAMGVGLLYFPIFEKRFGKTPGKHLMRLQVRDETGAEITWGQAIIRRLPLYFELIVLDAIFVPFSKRKQRAFDMVADTIVVRDHDGSARTSAWLLFLGLIALAVLIAVSVVVFSGAAIVGSG